MTCTERSTTVIIYRCGGPNFLNIGAMFRVLAGSFYRQPWSESLKLIGVWPIEWCLRSPLAQLNEGLPDALSPSSVIRTELLVVSSAGSGGPRRATFRDGGFTASGGTPAGHQC
jgi:hypothetical protein